MRGRNNSGYETIIYTLVMILIILLQSTIGESLRVFGVKPNLTLVFVICYAILEGSYKGAKAGLFAGVLTDLLMGRYIGFYGLIFMYCAIITAILNRNFHKENYLPVIFTSFLLSIVIESVIYIITRMSSDMNYVFILGKYIMIEAVYNMVLSMFFYFSLNVVKNRFSGQQLSVKF